MLSAPLQREEEAQEVIPASGLLRAVPTNVVQSIRAFRVTELQEEAVRLGQHFLYAHCRHKTRTNHRDMRHHIQSVSPAQCIRVLVIESRLGLMTRAIVIVVI